MTENTTYAHSVEARHIVSQNEKLHETNLDLRKNLSEVENERDKYEEEVESREKQVTYLRGLLKNFVAMKKEQDTITCLAKTIEKNNSHKQKQYHKYKQACELECLLFKVAIFVWFVADKFYTLPNSTITTSAFVLAMSVHFMTRRYKFGIKNEIERHDTQTITTKKTIENCAIEIKSVEKACDFLNEYVDVI